MQTFQALYDRAAERKGGERALEKLLPKPKSTAALRRVPDDRWLAGMTQCVFQAGFSWQVVENMWPGFEEVFEGFAPGPLAHLSDDGLEALVRDKRIVRHWRKIEATRRNARWCLDLAEEHGSAARFFADYPAGSYVDLLHLLKTEGAWLGGSTGQYFLRRMGKDSFILSRDVVTALQREKVITGTPGSRSAMADVQAAFNHWVDDGGGSLTRVSRVLGFTVGP